MKKLITKSALLALAFSLSQCSVDEIPAPDSPNKSNFDQGSKEPTLSRKTNDGSPEVSLGVSDLYYPALEHDPVGQGTLLFRINTASDAPQRCDITFVLDGPSFQEAVPNRLYSASSASYSFNTERHDFENLYSSDISMARVSFETVTAAEVSGVCYISGEASFGFFSHEISFSLYPVRYADPIIRYN